MRGRMVEWITGGAPPDTCGRFSVCGTDLGLMWDAGNGTVLTMFGDTYSLPNQQPGGSDWRCNTIGATRDSDLRDGLTITWMATDRDKHARQVIPRDSRVTEETVIPTSGVSVGPRNYVTYMSVKAWGDPGKWATNYAGIAYSDDFGATWTKPDNVRWFNTAAGDQNWQMCAMVHSGEYVYLFGTPNGRYGSAKLARVPETKVLDLAQHEQWDGQGWVKDPAQAATVIPGPLGELSVMWHEPTQQWLAGYSDDANHKISACTAPELTGPWSEPEHVVSNTDWPGLYGCFWHPWSSEMDTPYFAMSQWGPYQAVLMKLNMDEPAPA